MKLVKDAKNAWRWFSMRIYFLHGSAIASWALVPEDMRAAVPSAWLAAGAIALCVAGMIGRLIDQGGGDA